MRSILLTLVFTFVLAGAPRATRFEAPLQLFDEPGNAGFVVQAGSERIRIEKDGWYDQRGGGLRFAERSRRAGFDRPARTSSYSSFIGRDPQKWIHGAPAYARIRERGVYPGVDVSYYGRSGNLEYDFELAPQADPRRIELQWLGSGSPKLESNGSLMLPDGMQLAAPVAYQDSGGSRAAVRCRYSVEGRFVRFETGPYDRSKALIIDPSVSQSAFIQASDRAIAADANGNIYLAGGSVSVTKRGPDGSLIWTANLAGIVPLNSPLSIGLDANGNVYVAGAAAFSSLPAQSFPTTPGALSTTALSPTTGFLSKLSGDGAQLLYSTLLSTPLLGQLGADQVTALAVSPGGQMTIAGTLVAPRDQLIGPPVAVRQTGSFVARLSADGTQLIYSRKLTSTVSTLAIDSAGNVVGGGVGSQADDVAVSLQRITADQTLYVSADSGATVQTLSGFPFTTAIAIDPSNPLTALRTTTSGVFQSADGGTSWNQIDSLGSDTFGSVWIHPTKPLLQFVLASPLQFNGGQLPLWRSEDGGKVWNLVVGQAPPAPYAVDGSNLLGGFIIGSTPPFSSSDDGKTWKQVPGLAVPLPNLQFPFICCAVDPSDAGHFLVGSLSNSLPGWGIGETRDGGATFGVINQERLIPIVFDPRLQNQVYGYGPQTRLVPALDGHYLFSQVLMKSDDGGHSWRLPSSGLPIPIQQLAVDPSGSGRMYVFGPLGVWRSDDRGENWNHLPGPLGNAPLSGGAVGFGASDRIYAVASPQGDGYLVKLDVTGNIVFSTLVGGRNMDKIQSVLMSQNGDTLIAGTTQSDDLLSAAGASPRNTGGFEQGFLARISADGSSLLAFRYLGGSSTDSITGMAMLSSGELAAFGSTASVDEPDVTTDAWQPRIAAGLDTFLAVFSADDLATRFYSFLGTPFTGVVATSGMKAYLALQSINGHFNGSALPCSGGSPQGCNEILASADLTP